MWATYQRPGCSTKPMVDLDIKVIKEKRWKLHHTPCTHRCLDPKPNKQQTNLPVKQ